MAKKQAKRAAKKPARAAQAKSTKKKSATAKGRASKGDEKYEQTGAPWWTMHLPE